MDELSGLDKLSSILEFLTTKEAGVREPLRRIVLGLNPTRYS